MNIAVIPARGGSKRIPRKDIRPFRGKPIIAYSIEAAKASGLFERIIVSTDDPETAKVAEEWGCEVHFMRPAHLAGDHTVTAAVILRALQWVIDAELTSTHIFCLHATSPFMLSKDIQQALELMTTHEADHCFPLVHHSALILRALKRDDQGRVQMFHPENRDVRLQDLEPAYYDAGQFYWRLSDALLRNVPVFSERSIGLVIPQWRVCDIDTPEDWRRAELMHEVLERGEFS